MKTDVVVLGAGIVGVSVALHLQARGRSVALVDRRGAGEETSYGNAGLIERSSVIPYAFPRDLASILRYGLNRSSQVHYQHSFLPTIMPWLFQYWRHSSPGRLAAAARDLLPLIEHSIDEHQPLIEAAGATSLLRDNGWIEIHRAPKSFEDAIARANDLRSYGLGFEVLDTTALHEREPSLSNVVGGIHWLDPASVSDPGAVTKGYADLLVRRGGQFIKGEARSLAATRLGWTVQTERGAAESSDVVVALGPWSADVFRPLGYRFPLAIKRGYHLHYAPAGNASLGRVVIDRAAGFALAPMTSGIRLTTGIEFAALGSPATPAQIAQDFAVARTVFPLGEPVEARPWLGNRPCLPDMRPVIGPAPRHKGLWFAFGHAHHGFTLGPVTGRLLAELMTGQAPFADVRPFRADRF